MAEARREAWSAAVGLGEASDLLAGLPGKSSSLVRAPAIHIDYREDACGRRAAEQANKTVIKAETFITIPLKEREFSAGVGKVDLQLVLRSNCLLPL